MFNDAAAVSGSAVACHLRTAQRERDKRTATGSSVQLTADSLDTLESRSNVCTSGNGARREILRLLPLRQLADCQLTMRNFWILPVTVIGNPSTNLQ